MKILMINVVCGIRSTGRICTDLAVELEKEGHEVKIAYGREKVPEQFKKYAVRIGSDIDVKMHVAKARILDGAGFGSKFATEKFIRWVKMYDPDIIHLHNIHGYYINVKVLFDYLKSCGKKIFWTLHDCWSFTGHCVYFDYVGCYKWRTECKRCLQKKQYPARMFIDCSKMHYQHKREMFTCVPNLTLITPSQWLANLVMQSYLQGCGVRIIHNGVDTSVFKPTDSDLKEQYQLQNKKVILGVAAIWDHRKGLESFIELSKKLESNYQIILVGLSKEQIKLLPSNIIGFEKTDSPEELATLYTLADVFVNPTLEDNYPTTNLEAIACGTPVITYDTGGSGESARMYGEVVAVNDIEGLVEAIENSDKIEKKDIKVDYKNTIREYVTLLSVN